MTHTLITQIRKIENIQELVLSYSFRKAIIFFNSSSDEMNKLAQSKFCHSGWYQYLFWPMDQSKISRNKIKSVCQNIPVR